KPSLIRSGFRGPEGPLFHGTTRIHGAAPMRQFFRSLFTRAVSAVRSSSRTRLKGPALPWIEPLQLVFPQPAKPRLAKSCKVRSLFLSEVRKSDGNGFREGLCPKDRQNRPLRKTRRNPISRRPRT